MQCYKVLYFWLSSWLNPAGESNMALAYARWLSPRLSRRIMQPLTVHETPLIWSWGMLPAEEQLELVGHPQVPDGYSEHCGPWVATGFVWWIMKVVLSIVVLGSATRFFGDGSCKLSCLWSLGVPHVLGDGFSKLMCPWGHVSCCVVCWLVVCSPNSFCYRGSCFKSRGGWSKSYWVCWGGVAIDAWSRISARCRWGCRVGCRWRCLIAELAGTCPLWCCWRCLIKEVAGRCQWGCGMGCAAAVLDRGYGWRVSAGVLLVAGGARPVLTVFIGRVEFDVAPVNLWVLVLGGDTSHGWPRHGRWPPRRRAWMLWDRNRFQGKWLDENQGFEKDIWCLT